MRFYFLENGTLVYFLHTPFETVLRVALSKLLELQSDTYAITSDTLSGIREHSVVSYL